MFLRQSTSQVIRFGPALDKSDGVTEETGLTLAQADMRLSKDGGAFAQKNAAGNATHDSDGWYSTTLDATDTDTVGILKLNVQQPANMLPIWETLYVVEESVYDNLFAGSAVGPATTAAIATAVLEAVLPKQNEALNNLPFLFVAASDHVTPVTGASGISVTRSIDGAAFAAATGTVAEIANGIYQFDASAGDMNGGIIMFRFVATGGTPGAPDDRFVTVVTSGGV